MITEKDFQDAIEATFDNESAATACFELAQRMVSERMVTEQYQKLIAHRDQTVGLWATDRKDLVKDEKNVLFQIKFK